MEHLDVDSGLLESIQNMSAEELVALQAEAEASGAAQQLRAEGRAIVHTRKRLTRRQTEALVRSAGAYTLNELITQLQAMREQLGGHVPVLVGVHGSELACAVDVVRWTDIENNELEYVAARICGV